MQSSSNQSSSKQSSTEDADAAHLTPKETHQSCKKRLLCRQAMAGRWPEQGTEQPG
jgi:hypothetical protein